MPIKTADLATELGVTDRAVELFADELLSVDGYDATFVDEQAHTLTDSAAAAVREGFHAGTPVHWANIGSPGVVVDDAMQQVKQAADEYHEAKRQMDAAQARRDEAIRALVARDFNRTSIASAAHISRKRLYQILDEAKAKQDAAQ
jgi:hypothetical protein